MKQGDGGGGFRAGVRGFSAFSRLLRSAVWLQGGAGPQPSLSPDPTGAGPAKASRPSTAVAWKAASPATTCPTLRRIHRWRPWHTREAPGGVLRPSSRRRRATWGWTSTRPALGGLASPCGPVPAGRGVSSEPATGLERERCRGSRGRRCTGWCGRCCPGNGSGRLSCWGGWRVRSHTTSGPAAAHAKCRAALRACPKSPP